MALDSTTQQNKDMKLKIKKNVGLALVKQKRFGKAIEVYEDDPEDQESIEFFKIVEYLKDIPEGSRSSIRDKKQLSKEVLDPKDWTFIYIFEEFEK